MRPRQSELPIGQDDRADVFLAWPALRERPRDWFPDYDALLLPGGTEAHRILDAPVGSEREPRRHRAIVRGVDCDAGAYVRTGRGDNFRRSGAEAIVEADGRACRP